MKNLHIHKKLINKRRKENRFGHKGFVVWLTGLSGSGKSTIANKLEKNLFNSGCTSIIIDGDSIRQGLNSDLGFSKEDREENIRRVGEVANLISSNGQIAIVSIISPFKKSRAAVREKIKKEFIEVFLYCNQEICEKRDPKGLYKKARNGKIEKFTGLDSPYEDPVNPNIKLDTGIQSENKCVEAILDYLIINKFIFKEK